MFNIVLDTIWVGDYQFWNSLRVFSLWCSLYLWNFDEFFWVFEFFSKKPLKTYFPVDMNLNYFWFFTIVSYFSFKRPWQALEIDYDLISIYAINRRIIRKKFGPLANLRASEMTSAKAEVIRFSYFYKNPEVIRGNTITAVFL